MNSHPYETRPNARRESTPFAREVYRDAEDAPQDSARTEVLEEIAALRAEVRTEVRALRGAMNRPKPASTELAAELAALRATVEQLLAVPAKKGDTYAALVRSVGIEGPAATALSRGKSAKANAGKCDEERLADAVTALVAVTPWPIASTEPRLIALVGPAGVGKTTTAAKLGARALRKKQSVAFISCDGYRVGALDQLRQYAELMDSPFHAVATAEELLTVVSGITADVIIVDTSGRAVGEGSVEAMLGDDRLRVEIAGNRAIEVMLCTPAALRSADSVRIARDFAPSRPTSVCVTKLDETDAPSALVHAPFATKLPISTLCFGQRVPEDIGTATHAEIVTRLVPAPKKITEQAKEEEQG
ncbi:MAG: Flagellar biosynthesis protein FlhF [Labilithrix sp.]|nr:Flagellar biosynthesis protein FlhF [Labilithrix sp.]